MCAVLPRLGRLPLENFLRTPVNVDIGCPVFFHRSSNFTVDLISASLVVGIDVKKTLTPKVAPKNRIEEIHTSIELL